MTAAASSDDIRVCVEQEDGQYVAQGVDHDIVGFGPDADAAIADFVAAYIRHCVLMHSLGRSLADVPPPAGSVRDRWLAQADRGDFRTFTIPPFTIHRRADPGHATARTGIAAIL